MNNEEIQEGFLLELIIGSVGAIFFVFLFFIVNKKESLGEQNNTSSFQIIELNSSSELRLGQIEVLNTLQTPSNDYYYIVKVEENDTLEVSAIGQILIEDLHVVNQMQGIDTICNHVYRLIMFKGGFQANTVISQEPSTCSEPKVGDEI